jgi:hypothetical protein
LSGCLHNEHIDIPIVRLHRSTWWMFDNVQRASIPFLHEQLDAAAEILESEHAAAVIAGMVI